MVWQGQAEVRWRLFWRLGVVGFAGVGQVAASLKEFADSDFVYAAGGGIRFTLSETERVNAGVDYAIANDGESAVYFRIGEAF